MALGSTSEEGATGPGRRGRAATVGFHPSEMCMLDSWEHLSHPEGFCTGTQDIFGFNQPPCSICEHTQAMQPLLYKTKDYAVAMLVLSRLDVAVDCASGKPNTCMCSLLCLTWFAVLWPSYAAVLESLVGPLVPLVSEQSCDPIPDDIMEHNMFLEPEPEAQGDTVGPLGHGSAASSDCWLVPLSTSHW